MEAALKELTKLEKLTGDSSAKAKSASIFDSLDSLLDSLRAARQLCVEDILPQDTCVDLSRTVEARKKDIDERQKEIYSSMSRLGKALEKVRVVGLICRENAQISEEIHWYTAVLSESLHI